MPISFVLQAGGDFGGIEGPWSFGIWGTLAVLIVLALLLASWLCCGWIGSKIARGKGREGALGWLLGLGFGPLGLAFLASLKSRGD